MSIRPDISVIVPCFNAERYLKVCLESLTAQKEPLIEMIFIDDGSEDATGALLDDFAREEPRARVIHIKNEGVSSARNRGIELAKGKYIAFVDADDALEGNAMEILYRNALKSNAQIISANHTLFDCEKGNRVTIEIEPVVQQPSEIVKEIIHMHRIYNNIWNKLYVSELFSNGLRLDERIKIGEDAMLNLRLYLHARSVFHVSENTYVYRVHQGSAMAAIDNYSDAHQPMLEGMDEILREEEVKELYFRDYLQSVIWIYEKEKGIQTAMSHFDEKLKPLILRGIDFGKIPHRDKWLLLLVQNNLFPSFYKLMRVKEKLTGKKWGIRR